MWKTLLLTAVFMVAMIGTARAQTSPPECSWEHGGVSELVPAICHVPQEVSATVINTPLPVTMTTTSTQTVASTVTVANLGEYSDRWMVAAGILILLVAARVVGSWGRAAE